MRDNCELSTIESGESELPSRVESVRHMAVIDRCGETVERACGECGRPTECKALPEERDRPGPAKRTICQVCATRHLRKKDLL